jgi:hypothetical protein
MRGDEEAAVRKCHWGNTFVFQWEGLEFFGAGSFRGLHADGMDVIIDCGAGVQQDRAIQDTGDASPTRQQQIIRINWPDGGVPVLTEKDWRSLIKKLRNVRSRSNKETLHILVCCVGGHGRTGTALAILAALTGIAPADPVIFVRAEYCRKAVETKAQCRYIREIAHIAVEDSLSLPGFDSSCESPLR